jgi:hypothetical protein
LFFWKLNQRIIKTNFLYDYVPLLRSLGKTFDNCALQSLEEEKTFIVIFIFIVATSSFYHFLNSFAVVGGLFEREIIIFPSTENMEKLETLLINNVILYFIEALILAI